MAVLDLARIPCRFEYHDRRLRDMPAKSDFGRRTGRYVRRLVERLSVMALLEWVAALFTA